MLAWEAIRAEFAWEGSWRDVCVRDVGLNEWRAVGKAIVQAGLRGTFTADGVVTTPPDDIATLFDRTEEAGVMWSFEVGGVQLNCHFFDRTEIEFDLDPREVVGQVQLDALVAFLLLLAEASSKSALMTPENMHDVPFIRVHSSGDIEYISSGGFFDRQTS